MPRFLSFLMPSEEKVRSLPRPDKIGYLRLWLNYARMTMYIPPFILAGLSVVLLKALPYSGQIPVILLCIALIGVLPTFLLVILLTRSSLTRCIDALMEERWT